eukprot:365427-Chlamydomonas_euryale.AAC.5
MQSAATPRSTHILPHMQSAATPHSTHILPHMQSAATPRSTHILPHMQSAATPAEAPSAPHWCSGARMRASSRCSPALQSTHLLPRMQSPETRLPTLLLPSPSPPSTPALLPASEAVSKLASRVLAEPEAAARAAATAPSKQRGAAEAAIAKAVADALHLLGLLKGCVSLLSGVATKVSVGRSLTRCTCWGCSRAASACCWVWRTRLVWDVGRLVHVLCQPSIGCGGKCGSDVSGAGCLRGQVWRQGWERRERGV